MTATNDRPHIVALAPHQWAAGSWKNRQHLLSRLAYRGWPVSYSPGALSVWNRDREDWRTAALTGRFETDSGVTTYRPGRLLARWPRVPAWDRLALRFHVREVLSPIKASWDHSGVAFVFHPTFLSYLPHLKPHHVVYHAYDAHGDRLAKLEEELVGRADLVTASSQSIANQLPGFGPAKARILPNGVDLSVSQAGAERSCPDDLDCIPRPRIAYFGDINRKVNLNLVAQIAQRRPSWHWVVVGNLQSRDLQSDEILSHGYRACMTCSNVHFLGHKQRLDVPAYLHYTDIHTIMYRLDGGWWEHAYPLKMHEYLAVGRPIVSTDLASVRPFEDVIALARTLDDWEQALEHAIHSGGVGTPDARRAVAEQNTWDKRVGQLEQWLFEMLER